MWILYAGLTFVVSIGFALYDWLSHSMGINIFGYDTSDGLGGTHKLSYLSAIIFALIMVGGMFCGALYRWVANQSDNVNLFRYMNKVLSSRVMLLAFLAAPITFFVVYLQIRDIPDTVIAALVSFQNGFFWQKTFETLSNSDHPLEAALAERTAVDK